MRNKELDQTLVLIKPDALILSLTGYVMTQLSEFHTGLRVAGTKIVNVSRMLAEEHYAEHRGKIFFLPLLQYIRGFIHYPNDPGKRKVKAIVYQGPDAVEKIRAIAGPTNPHIARDQKPGCIRSLGTVIPLKNEAGEVVGSRMDNLVHASATLEEAEREIKLWLKPTDLPPLMRAYAYRECDEFFYYHNGQLHTAYEPGSICLCAPGDIMWESDWTALQAIQQGKSSFCSLQAVAAKYLINDDRFD